MLSSCGCSKSTNVVHKIDENSTHGRDAGFKPHLKLPNNEEG